MNGEAEHVRAGGSKAHRILACPASLRLEDEAPADTGSCDARLGTAAHRLLEHVLRLGTPGGAATWIGTPFIVEGETFVVDGEMAEAVQVAVDWVDKIKAAHPDAIVLLEQRVTWAGLKPSEEMRGSADIIIKLPSRRTLGVADYKHGIGQVVEAENNAQGRFYAVGALLADDSDLYDWVEVTIIQPRAYHPDGPIRGEQISVEELWTWAALMKEAVRIGGMPDAPAHAGPQCKFCRAAPTCATHAAAILKQAQDEFGGVSLPPAKIMDPGEVSQQLLRLEPVVDAAAAWIKEAKAFLHARASSGTKVPGYKLVPTRPMRVWNNLNEVKTWAELECGLALDDYAPREILSPAQMEKLVGKRQLPGNLYSSVSSGTNLVRDTAEGAPVTRLGAADEFSITLNGEPK